MTLPHPLRSLRSLHKQDTVFSALSSTFRGVFLTDTEQEQVERFLYYIHWNQSENFGLSYNILLTSDDPEITDLYLHSLIGAYGKVSGSKARVRYENVSSLPDNIQRNDFSSLDILVLLCDDVQDAQRLVDQQYVIETLLPPIKIIVVDSEVRQTLRQSDHLYFRILANHHHMHSYSISDVFAGILGLLADNEYSYDDTFSPALSDYLSVVYPKADLTGKRFTEDLWHRLAAAHFSRPEPGSFSEADIPFYRKPTGSDDSAASEHQPEKEADSNGPESDIGSIMQEPLPQNSAPSDVSDIAPVTPITVPEHISPEDFLQNYKSTTSTGQNVLLLSLSTFAPAASRPEGLQRTSYSFGKKQDIVYGLYQLDPIPEMLKKRGITIDYCVILATEKTKESVSIHSEDYTGPISPLDYFKFHLADKLSSSDNNALPRILVVDTDEAAPETAIKDASAILRAINQTNPVSLYIDSHGGFRDVQLILAAITSLLKQENLPKVHAYTIRYDAHNSVNAIVNDDTMKLFDFVSGINEFENTGRIDMLRKYLDFKHHKQFLSPISRISEGLQMCNIASLNSGLEQLRQYYASNNAVEDSYLRLFESRIKDDFSSMIRPNATVIDKVTWCMKKGFYQQALTFIESDMHQVLENGQVYRPINVPVKDKQYKKKLLDSLVFFLPVYDQDSGNSLFIKSIDSYWTSSSQKAFENCFSSQIPFDDQTKKLEDFLDSKYSQWKAQVSSALKTANCYSDKNDKNSNNTVTPNVVTFKATVDSEYIYLFLFLHKTIKGIRNKLNHASGNNPYSVDAVKVLIAYYMELVRCFCFGKIPSAVLPVKTDAPSDPSAAKPISASAAPVKQESASQQKKTVPVPQKKASEPAKPATATDLASLAAHFNHT